jgi:hypothetical protein
VSYYERVIEADFGIYSVDADGFKIVSNHPYGHGMVITDFHYNMENHELTFANNLAGTVVEPAVNEKISDTLRRIWSDGPVKLNWTVQSEWPAAMHKDFIESMLEMTWEEFFTRNR